MPVFTPDFGSVSMNMPMYEKGRYQIQVTKRTPFHKTGKEVDGVAKVSAGVRFALEMVGQFDDAGDLQTDDLKGKQVSSYTVWLHSEGGWQFGKPFMAAACGYRRNQEAEANEFFQENEWDFAGELDADAETFELGAGWDLPVGQLVDVNMSVERSPNPADEDNPYENQEFGGWAPVS